MNHQLIDLWLQNPSAMPVEQSNQLQVHLDTCAECKRIYSAWNASESLVRAAPLVGAPTGFSSRFHASLATRRARLHRRQTRIVLLTLLGIFLAAAAILLVRFFSDYSPIQVLAQGIQFFSTAPSRLLEFRYILSFWLGEIPPTYLIIAAIIISGWTFIALFSWMLAIFRIRHQGVTQ